MKTKYLAFSLLVITSLFTISCGKDTGNQTYSGKGILLQVNPVAGPAAAFLRPSLFDSALGIQTAHASVSAFDVLKMCVGEVVYETVSGQKGSSPSPLKPGLIDISPTSTEPQTIGVMDLEAGTKLKNIKFTIEKVPAICQNAEYAIWFKSGSDEKKITQNTSFKFDFDPAGYEVKDSNVVTLYFGKIVDSMVQMGSNLNNESVQTVNAGQAK